MNGQKLSPWEPLPMIPRNMYVEAVHDDYEGLRMLLKGADPDARMLRLKFDSVVGYRNVNESYRHRTWSNMQTGVVLPTLRIVENSGWVDWLVDESSGLLRATDLTHYAIHSVEDCIDIVTEFEPEVAWLN